MASLTLVTSGTRLGYRLQFRTKEQRKRSIWLGGISKRDATKFQSNLESLIESSRVNTTPDARILEWVNGIDERFKTALAQYGLIPQQLPLVVSEDRDVRLLGDLVDHYVSEQKHFSTITKANFKQVRSWAVDYFGAKCVVSSITPAKFVSWMTWMVHSDEDETRKTLSTSSAKKHAKRLRQVLSYGVKAKLLNENVADGIKIGDETNDERKHYVDRATATAVINHCPTMEWKLLFALARYCGLRIPTEVHVLKWSDVLWDQNRLRIDSKKTGLRYCPLFEPALKLLREASKTAPMATHIFPNRNTESNLRTHMHRIIKSAGLVPWPKVFVNLRSSCRSDLEDNFRETVINAWIGHSTKVGQKHYSQVRPSDWEEANRFGGSAGGSIHANQGGIPNHHKTEKPGKSLVLMGTDSPSGGKEYPRQGSNLWPQL